MAMIRHLSPLPRKAPPKRSWKRKLVEAHICGHIPRASACEGRRPGPRGLLGWRVSRRRKRCVWAARVALHGHECCGSGNCPGAWVGGRFPINWRRRIYTAPPSARSGKICGPRRQRRGGGATPRVRLRCVKSGRCRGRHAPRSWRTQWSLMPREWCGGPRRRAVERREGCTGRCRRGVGWREGCGSRHRRRQWHRTEREIWWRSPTWSRAERV